MFFQIEVPASGNIEMSTGNNSAGVAFYDSCSGTELFCGQSGSYYQIFDLPAGETIILQVWQYNTPDFLNIWAAEIPDRSGIL